MTVPCSLRALAGLGLAFAVACSDSAGPGTLTNPLATSAALSSVDSAFAAPAVASFGALGAFIAPTAALSRAATVVDATRPRPIDPATPPEVAAARHLAALRGLVPASPANPQGPLIPDTLYGSIFTWDEASTSYVRSQTSGGPANGVRFILYAINPLTGLPSAPLTEVGQADLLDESAGQVVELRILVQGVGGTPTYLDYDATLTFGAGTVTATVNGLITNGLAPGANKTLTFDVTATLSFTSATVDATFTLNNPSISIVLDASVTRSGQTETVTVSFTFTRPGETVRLQGTSQTTAGALDTLSAEIRVNGQVYATLEGNAQGVTFFDANGDVIQDAGAQHDILVALDHLREAVEDTLEFIEDLFDPIENLLPG
ncbi:MAG: hypothetical protein ACREMF_05720 [Gemmatimonadales bacterium]